MQRFAAALAAVLVCAAPSAHALPFIFATGLSGAAEAPPVESPGTGASVAVIDTDTHLLQVVIEFENLVGLTVAAHIHCCTGIANDGLAIPATAVPTLPDFPLGLSGGLYANVLDLADPASWNPDFLALVGDDTGLAEQFLLAGMLAQEAYVNVHTDFAPGGEIRGFYALVEAPVDPEPEPEPEPVPEPASMALLGLGLAALGSVRRVRRAMAG
jgi:hypothetical protein